MDISKLDELMIGRKDLSKLSKADLLAFAEHCRDQYQTGKRQYVRSQEALETANARIDDMRESSRHANEELIRMRGKNQEGDAAILEVQRLNGVLAGLERAGKIDPVPEPQQRFDQFGNRIYD